MSDHQEKHKQIELKTESGSIKFDDYIALQSWINKQKLIYKYHNPSSQKYALQNVFQQMEQAWAQLAHILSNGIQRQLNNPDQYNAQINKFVKEFQNYLNQGIIFTSDAPHSTFISQQAKIRPEYGVVAIAEIYNHNIQNIDKHALDGIEQVKKYMHGTEERSTNEWDKLIELKIRWNDELEKHKQEWSLQYSNELTTARSLNDESAEILQKWKDQIELNTKELNDTEHSFKLNYERAFDSAKNELERITTTYDAKLSLQASVRYWGLQKKHHDNRTIAFGITLAVSAILVIIGLLVFSSQFLDVNFKEIHISRLVSAAVLTTFGIWVIKILSNIFMSHMHLATDAQERRTMIHTYLALTRKGHGPKEEDRQLILQTLFRPSTSGMVKEDSGPANLVDMVNRLASRNTN